VLKENTDYILWLPSWYPTEITPSNGDFIQRHAAATSLFRKIIILFVQKDERLKHGKTRLEVKEEGDFITLIGYYGASGNSGFIDKFRSFRQYRSLQKKMFAGIVGKYGKPLLVHVHIAMNAGLLALHLKKKYQIPFLLTENWTGYYRQSVPNIHQENRILNFIRKKIFKETALFLPVTNNLAETVNSNFQKVKFEVVPNVVDTRLFNYKPLEIPVFRFLHASYLNYQKNPVGMIEAAIALKQHGYSFELHLIGNKDDSLMNKCAEAGVLDREIFFFEAVSYPQVAERMQQASAFLLFSRFENLPCVILEALCCGLPVVSSNVGGIAEVINESNGVLVESDDVSALTVAMKNMIDNYTEFNREKIAENAAELFSYRKVGRMYNEVYEKLLT
jgi:glycosyltransferase involved in cell wall biosynthesis